MASTSPSDKPIHLIVLCHGLWGEPKHLHTLATLLRRSFGSRASISKGTGGHIKKKQVGPGDVDSSSSASSSNDNSVDSDEAKEEAVLEKYIEEYVNERKGEEEGMDVLILNSMSNKGTKTYDGIDWIAERVVREIKAEQDAMQKQSQYIARFSIIGYSLGGLVARYVIGLLDSRSFFSSSGGKRPVEARQFATFATPHIGVPPANGVFGKIANYIGGRLLSRTGEQLYLLDSGWESDSEVDAHERITPASSSRSKVGLVESMSRPGSTFIRALNRFKKVTLYANAVNDMTVPYRTGCIEEWDPFHEHQGSVDVEMIAETPLLAKVEPRTAPELTFWQGVRSMAPSLPFFLNPKRLPMRAPYNYLVILGLPVLLPTFVVLVLFNFTKESKRSRARVLELDRDWDMEEGRGKGEKDRIDHLMRSVMMSAGEDQVDQESSILPTSPVEEDLSNVHKSFQGVDSARRRMRSPLDVPTTVEKPKQPPLLEAQKRMIRALNDPKIVPRLEKRWTYFDDVINSHAIIVW
ncbi:hypothetical protein CBS101457_004188 [Exobasidium rhododendri]|nr:hypothetical protein CBS101457_004188 [Exobasidium rhododendri]